MRVVAGVDCHKSTHTAVFIDRMGREVGSITFPASAAGYQVALEKAETLGCGRWGLEGTGSYGYAFAVCASVRGAEVFEVPGAYTKRHRKNSSRRGKSDRQDAKASAEAVLRESERLPRFTLALVQRALRLRYDQRDRLVRERTKAVNRVRDAAVRLGVTELARDLTSDRAARDLLELARQFGEDGELHVAALALVDELIDGTEDILRINGRVRRATKHMRPLVRAMSSRLLDLRGVSTIVAAGLIGHTGDLRNLRDASAFAMKAGVAPIQASSGRSAAVRLNTGGDRQLNRLLHVIAMTQTRTPGHEGRQYYDRKRGEGKTHRAAMRCLKRQLATVVYYRLREDQEASSSSESSALAA